MKRPEDNLQRAIVDYVRMVAPDCFLHSIPNDAQRSQSDTWRMYWTGFVKGMFDLCLLAPGGQAHYIEIKCKGNTLSDAQEGIKERFIQMGVPHVVAYSLDDVKAALQQWQLIRPDRAKTATALESQAKHYIREEHARVDRLVKRMRERSEVDAE